MARAIHIISCPTSHPAPVLTGIESYRNNSIESIMEEAPTFSEEDRVAKAIGYLKKSGANEVFVGDEKRILGATVRDLLYVTDPSNARIGSVVYSFPEVTPRETLAHAARLMFDYKLRALPSRQAGGTLKTVTATAILRMVSQRVEIPGSASEVMTPTPVTVDADDTVLKARAIMTRRGFDQLPVMKDGKLQEVLTSSDILFSLLPEERATTLGKAQVRLDYPVSNIARENVLEVEPSTPLSEVVRQMLKLKSHYAVVSLWDEVQGIVTVKDALKPLIPTERRKSPIYIVGLPADPFEAEAARMKLERVGTMLTRAIPSVREIRAVVKSKNVRPGRNRYEVRIEVYASGGVYAYSGDGYDLASIFDGAGPRLKRILSSKQSRVTRSHGESLRKL